MTREQDGALFRSVIVGCMARACQRLDLVAVGWTDEEAEQMVTELSPKALARLEREIEARIDLSGISIPEFERGE